MRRAEQKAGSGGSGRAEVAELSAEQQEKLQRFKIKLRIDNERYLKSHPEVDVMIGDFLGNVLLKRPTDVREFAADHFSDPNLPVVIASKMEGNMERTKADSPDVSPFVSFSAHSSTRVDPLFKNN